MAYRRSTKNTARSAAGWTKTSFRRSNGRKGSVRVKAWSSSEISALRKCYKNTTNSQIAKQFGRTVASVRAKAGQLNLKKNKNFLSECAKTAKRGTSRRNSRSWSAKSSSRRTVARRASSRRRSTARRSSVRRATKRSTRRR